jgi:hypothetical protein
LDLCLRARTIATEHGMRPLVTHCHLELGKFYRRTGKRQEAHEHLTTATTMYREMDMRFCPEQAEAEMKGWHDVSTGVRPASGTRRAGSSCHDLEHRAPQIDCGGTCTVRRSYLCGAAPC